ncbi:hypothetical protein IL306_005727 [Fusarium sp. DS 682]|nr:hypothetical protein IL306_005727 [Fusarium sp. DS 682]
MNRHSSVQTQSKLCTIPPEIVLDILEATEKFSDKVSLAKTCRGLYDLLILAVYREAGKQLNWQPMFEAAEDGNCRTLARCIEVGAPIDYRPARGGLRPLQLAIIFYRPITVKWLLDHGANPNYVEYDEGNLIVSCPLAQAVESVIRPGISLRSVPRRWELRGIRIPSNNRLARNGREMVKALRQAGADEKHLGFLELLHLDSIQAGIECCSYHKTRLWGRLGGVWR